MMASSTCHIDRSYVAFPERVAVKSSTRNTQRCSVSRTELCLFRPYLEHETSYLPPGTFRFVFRAMVGEGTVAVVGFCGLVAMLFLPTSLASFCRFGFYFTPFLLLHVATRRERYKVDSTSALEDIGVTQPLLSAATTTSLFVHYLRQCKSSGSLSNPSAQ